MPNQNRPTMRAAKPRPALTYMYKAAAWIVMLASSAAAQPPDNSGLPDFLIKMEVPDSFAGGGEVRRTLIDEVRFIAPEGERILDLAELIHAPAQAAVGGDAAAAAGAHFGAAAAREGQAGPALTGDSTAISMNLPLSASGDDDESSSSSSEVLKYVLVQHQQESSRGGGSTDDEQQEQLQGKQQQGQPQQGSGATVTQLWLRRRWQGRSGQQQQVEAAAAAAAAGGAVDSDEQAADASKQLQSALSAVLRATSGAIAQPRSKADHNGAISTQTRLPRRLGPAESGTTINQATAPADAFGHAS